MSGFRFCPGGFLGLDGGDSLGDQVLFLDQQFIETFFRQRAADGDLTNLDAVGVKRVGETFGLTRFVLQNDVFPDQLDFALQAVGIVVGG